MATTKEAKLSIKVGDYVRHNGEPTHYTITQGDFIGKVVSMTGEWMDVKIIRHPSVCKEQYSGDGPYNVRIADFEVCDVDGLKLTTKTVATARKSGSTAPKHPQFFMEGVDARIVSYPMGGYYDCMTEDYEGKVGNIVSYDEYDDMEDCWIVTMRMEDGEHIEVLESELQNFKRTKPSAVKAVPKPTPVKSNNPCGEISLGRTYHPPVVDYVDLVKAVQPGPTKAGKTASVKTPVKFDNIVKVFDLTPKKKVRKSIFKSQ